MGIGRREFLASLAITAVGTSRLSRAGGDGEIHAVLERARAQAEVPGLVAAVLEPGRPTRVASAGVRKVGSPEPIAPGDRVHLGSCSKAMTATMIATLVQDGRIAWATTLGDVFPEVRIAEACRRITLDQLLTHRSGLPANLDWSDLKPGSTTEQRREALASATAKAPDREPGAGFEYSNVGYALAGLMAETVAREPWEGLMRDRVFRPLGMETAGFGPPGEGERVDQPWGHARVVAGLVPRRDDNPPAMGPAGTVHASIADWAKFAALHLAGARGEATPILTPDRVRELHTPSHGGDYAKGWIVADRPWSGPGALTHSGSNTLWFATAWIAPRRNLALLAAANVGGDAGDRAVERAIADLIPAGIAR